MTVFFGATSYQAFQALVKDPQKFYDQQAKDSATKSQIDYFKKKIGTIENIDDLTKDRKLMSVILSAYSMQDEIDRMGRIKKVLKEDPASDEDALANQLSDTKFKSLATGLALYEDGAFDKFDDEEFVQGIIDKFIQNETEVSMGEQDTALREAAYFARNISSNTSTVYNILGDKVLRSVMTQYFELPTQFAVQSVESQAAYINKRIDITKFGKDDTSSEGASEVANAKANITTLESAQKVTDAASTQITSIKEILENMLAAYDEQAELANPSGENAAEIPVQEAAIPSLLRFESMASSMQTTMATVATKLSELETLLNKAKNPANASNLTTYKSQFTTAANAIISAINSTSSYNPATGTTENPLMYGSNSTLSVTTTADGDKIDFKVYDLTDLQTYLNQAKASFSAVTSASDTANLNAAASAFSSAEIRGLSVKEYVSENITALAEGVDNIGTFAATLNTNQIMRGYNSINDSLTRVTKIEGYLAEIKTLANTSQNMLATADRTELQAKFVEYRDAIREEIENGGVGLDNFLNNIATQSYNVIGTSTLKVQGGYDLATNISNVLDAGGVDTLAGAKAMYTTTITSTIYTDAAKSGLTSDKGLFTSVVNVYDSKASISNAANTLEQNLAKYISDAASGGSNLLAEGQKDLTYSVTSSFYDLTVHAYSGFQDEFQTLIDNIQAAMPLGTAQTETAINAALDYISDIDRGISSDNRKLNFEYVKSSSVVDAFDTTDETEENPYENNKFTQKFIERFLILNGSDNLMSSSSNSYVLSLFGVSSDGSSTDYMSNIMSLVNTSA